MEQRTDLGLVKGHAYCITAVRKVLLGGTSLVSLFKYVIHVNDVIHAYIRFDFQRSRKVVSCPASKPLG